MGSDEPAGLWGRLRNVLAWPKGLGRAARGVVFSRRQLIDPDYNPLEDPAGPDRGDLEQRYGAGSRRAGLDHAAAVRGILVSEGKRRWRWIWDWGLLHDEMVRKHGYDRLDARYRNQFSFLPTIEFEQAPVAEALRMLLRQTPILPDDNIQITAWRGFRAFCIRDALAQLGEPLEGAPAAAVGPPQRR